jgi:hypothetical protein
VSHTFADRWTYHDDASRRPFLHPVRAPSGAVLTRDAPADHPWHHGLWFTIKFVNGENFWEEYDAYGVLRHVGEPSVSPTSLSGTVHWTRPDRETVVIDDERRLAHVDLGADAYAIDFSLRLTPRADVLLDRTPFTTWGGYGGLALRGRPDWEDTRLVIANDTGGDMLRGERSDWCDLSGHVDGTEAGILLLYGAGNPRSPVPWYGTTRSANYGDEGWSNFLNAAFLWDEPLLVAAGETLPFDFRVVVHDGTWHAARCAAAWDAWTDGHG